MPKETLPVSPIAMYHRIYSSSFLPPLNAGSSQDSTTDVSVTFTTVTFLGLEGGSVCVCVCVCVGVCMYIKKEHDLPLPTTHKLLSC